MRLARSTEWKRLFHRLRTEGDTPVRQASAVALGLFIGCTPFYGFHLTLAVLFGTLFRLNRLKVYIASHISNPFMAPFLYASEIQVGAWLRRGTWYLPSTLSTVSWWHIAGDVLLGAAVVGAALAVVGGACTYAIVNRRGLSPGIATLVEGAASRFVDEGVAAWEFAHGKLRGDPVYLDVLRSGVLPQHGSIVDLGCGQGLMLALLLSARDAYRRGAYPAGWPAPPLSAQLIGIEQRSRVARTAARAFASDATILERDITSTPIPRCSGVLVFDVLHLTTPDDQDALIREIHASLDAGGVLVLREADPNGGWRFAAVRIGNRLTALSHGRWRRAFHFRAAAEWRRMLAAAGFLVETPVASTSAPFANIIIYARKP